MEKKLIQEPNRRNLLLIFTMGWCDWIKIFAVFWDTFDTSKINYSVKKQTLVQKNPASFLPNNFTAKLNKQIFSVRIRSNLSIQAEEVMCNHHNHVNRRLSVYACMSLKWHLRLRPGVRGAGSKPPSRSRRSPPAMPLVLLDRPGAEPPVVEVGFRTSSEPPSKSSRSQT